MKMRIIGVTFLMVVLGVGFANAQDASELSEIIESDGIGETLEERVEVFRKEDHANQWNLLQQAQAEKRALEQRSVRLETNYEENEERLWVQTEVFETRLSGCIGNSIRGSSHGDLSTGLKKCGV